jgi:hypothetical protein
MHCFQHWVFSFEPGAPTVEKNMLFLFNWSVALLLCFMSLIAFAAAKNGHAAPKHMKTVSVILVVTWMCRLILEVIYPVEFQFLVFHHPTSIIKVGIICVVAVLLFPYVIPEENHTHKP